VGSHANRGQGDQQRSQEGEEAVPMMRQRVLRLVAERDEIAQLVDTQRPREQERSRHQDRARAQPGQDVQRDA